MVFKDLSIKDGYVVLTLNDGKNSQMRIPFSSGELLLVHIDSAGTLENLLTPEQQRIPYRISLRKQPVGHRISQNFQLHHHR